MIMKTAFYYSPIGTLEVQLMDEYIVSIKFLEHSDSLSALKGSDNALNDCFSQLDEYFYGTRKEFTFPICQEGTDFQQQVWTQLQTIPYGKTISYAEMSKQLGDIKKIRAVGAANGKNNLAIVVPCHRVIGSNHQLIGYAGGLWRKRWLLDHEAKYSHGVRQLNLI
jgi:methylated-DNA-[protein]-cysteine S-methyltransferase